MLIIALIIYITNSKLSWTFICKQRLKNFKYQLNLFLFHFFFQNFISTLCSIAILFKKKVYGATCAVNVAINNIIIKKKSKFKYQKNFA